MLRRKIFGKFTYCNGYFSAFKIIFRHILFNFFDANSECFAKYDAVCSRIFNYACVWLIAMEEVRNYKKIAYIKNI